MTAVIQAIELSKQFGAHRAVDELTLSVQAGEIYGLVGSDGAGKTTTLRMLVGALRPSAGSCSVAGYDLTRQPERARSYLGYLSQRFSMYEELSVLENIRFFAEVRGLGRRDWLPLCMSILDFVGLASFKDRQAGQLSGGMKQKLGLASALVSQPQVLLLDEPTTGVDPVTRQDFWQLLVELVSGGSKTDAVPGVTVMISTPYMDEAARCHRVGFMRHGRLIAEDTPSQLRSMLAGRVLELRGSPQELLRRTCHEVTGIQAVQAFGDRLHLRVAPGQGERVGNLLPGRIAAAGGKVDRLRNIPPSLEDVFIQLSETTYE